MSLNALRCFLVNLFVVFLVTAFAVVAAAAAGMSLNALCCFLVNFLPFLVTALVVIFALDLPNIFVKSLAVLVDKVTALDDAGPTGLAILKILSLITLAFGALILVVVALPSTPAINLPLTVFIVSPGFAVCTIFLVVCVPVTAAALVTVLIPIGGMCAFFGVGISAVFF